MPPRKLKTPTAHTSSGGNSHSSVSLKRSSSRSDKKKFEEPCHKGEDLLVSSHRQQQLQHQSSVPPPPPTVEQLKNGNSVNEERLKSCDSSLVSKTCMQNSVVECGVKLPLFFAQPPAGSTHQHHVHQGSVAPPTSTVVSFAAIADPYCSPAAAGQQQQQPTSTSPSDSLSLLSSPPPIQFSSSPQQSSSNNLAAIHQQQQTTSASLFRRDISMNASQASIRSCYSDAGTIVDRGSAVDFDMYHHRASVSSAADGCGGSNSYNRRASGSHPGGQWGCWAGIGSVSPPLRRESVISDGNASVDTTSLPVTPRAGYGVVSTQSKMGLALEDGDCVEIGSNSTPSKTPCSHQQRIITVQPHHLENLEGGALSINSVETQSSSPAAAENAIKKVSSKNGKTISSKTADANKQQNFSQYADACRYAKTSGAGLTVKELLKKNRAATPL